MKRTNKIAFGIAMIIFSFISAGIGFWLLADIAAAYNFFIRFLIFFFLISTPVLTILGVINLLKMDK